MITPDLDQHAVALRHGLVDQLAADGTLRSPAWRNAFERVPRHRFVPEGYERAQGRWRRLTAATDPDRWLALVYQDRPVITQLNGRPAEPGDATPAGVAGTPTSSSSAPGLTAVMLEALDIHHGNRVLEIGTGTGYTAALLTARLDRDQVVSIDIDPDLVTAATDRLRRAGYAPEVAVTDGADGYPARAPYDRVIATCGVRRIPAAWLRQTRRGGLILAPVAGPLGGGAMFLLEVGPDQTARGRGLPAFGSFMPLTGAAGRAGADTWAVPSACSADARITDVSPQVLKVEDFAWWLQLHLPGARTTMTRSDGGPWEAWLADGQSSARVVERPDGGWLVAEHGPRPLWAVVEAAHAAWRQEGEPGYQRFTLVAEGEAQRIVLDTGARWDLPE